MSTEHTVLALLWVAGGVVLGFYAYSYLGAAVVPSVTPNA